MLKRLKEIRDGLFFIVGAHRSGTTLLQAMLSSHSALTIPPETSFFDQVWPRRQALGMLTDEGARLRAGRYINGPDCSVSDLGLNWNEITRHLGETPGGYADLFAVLLALYGNARSKRRVGEKSPRHLFHIRTILEVFPQAKFICLIRDPRAVVRSEMETSWGSKSVQRIARRWCRVVREATVLQQELPASQFRVVRYEDLVREPEQILRSLCEFLNEPFEPAMLKFQERPASEHGFRLNEHWKQKTLSPIDASRIDVWRERLTPGQIDLIERDAGECLEKMGYAKSDVACNWRHRTWTQMKDRVRWGWEVIRGIVRGRSRRRPWFALWTDLWSGWFVRKG